MKSVSRIKIGIGFALMLGILLFTLFFVNREMDRLTRTETESSAVWDSLAMLLKDKDENTLRLLRMVGQASDSLLSATDIARIIERHDTVVIRQQISRHVVTRRDTLRTPPTPKKGFFKRLGEAFSPPKEDTAIQVRVTTEVATDTVVYDTFNPVDSLKEELEAAARKRQELDKRNTHKRQYLQRLDRLLNNRIDSLLKGHEQQVFEQARYEQAQKEQDRLRAARTVGGIAVGGVVLSTVFLILIGRDVARSNRYRLQIEEAREKAEQLLATRERMMMAITHDFKAPLGTIKGYIGLLERLTEDPRQRFYLKAMTDSADHLLKLVTDLLEFHRLERGHAKAERVAFSPAELIKEIADSFRPQTKAKGLELHTDTSPELKGNFIGDPLRIRQIVTNLMGNAVKFTEQGSVILTARYDTNQRLLAITVADTGPGMKSEERERIWAEFSRLPGAQGKEGCGLGLSIVKLLTELLEGQVEVESEIGQGSRFTVKIPLFAVAENGNRPVRSPSALSARPRKLLLIDDDRLQLQLTQAMLQEAGIESVACLQVDSLLEALRSEHFDALLTDVQMPAVNGLDLLRLLRASNIPQARTIPVIAVTARADMEREEMRIQGFAGLLYKPFGLKELAKELNVGTLSSSDKSTVWQTGLNFGALTAYSGDDTEAAHNILQTFVDETQHASIRLQQAIQHDDAREIAAVAHKLIPLFALIGADEVVGTLRKLEALEGTTLAQEDKELTTKALKGIKAVLKEAPCI